MPALEPAGRSNWTFHPVIVVVPPLVIVYLPSKPLPQSDVLTNVAVGPAAYAARWVARTIVAVALTDPWAVRELTICIRSFDELPPYARQLVEHLRAGAAPAAEQRHRGIAP